MLCASVRSCHLFVCVCILYEFLNVSLVCVFVHVCMCEVGLFGLSGHM
jgi:hypothetical protein